jgi:hypothetical protein
VVNPGHLGGFYSGEKGSRHCPALIFFHLPANASLWFCVDHMTTSWSLEEGGMLTGQKHLQAVAPAKAIGRL